MDTMSSFEFQGHEVFYRREGAGPPMVFLHNGGTSHRIWEPLLERYGEDHDVVAMDMLGFGRSARPRIDYALDLYVAQLGSLLEELGFDEVTLVGNCMGSATALSYARQNPERVNAVVAVNVLTERTAASGLLRPLLGIARLSPRGARLLGRLSARVWTPKPMAAAAVRRTLVADPSRIPKDLLDHLREANRHPDQLRVLLSIGANIESFAGMEDKPDGVPVCVIWGGDNRVLPAIDGAQFCAALQPDREIVVPDSGHLVMLERPAEVAAAIDGFLARHDERGARGEGDLAATSR